MSRDPVTLTRDVDASVVPVGTKVTLMKGEQAYITQSLGGAHTVVVNGNMFLGLFGSDVGVKLPPDAAAELLAIEGAGPFGPAERPMSGWVTLPAGSLTSGAAGPWIARAREFVATLKPK